MTFVAKSRPFAALLLAGALLAPGAALADVKAGVDAWSRGDYAAAVREWQGPAAAGDPDALFNLAQAYRLGRGVPADPAKAEDLYAQAAARGHLPAADTYGLMLFQAGRKQEALPYVIDAARRGDPRSQYLLGIAYFNGDMVQKDWVQAYALVMLANSQGLPQAAPALAQMDQHIPIEQRQQAAGLAQTMQRDADAARAQELAAADLGQPSGAVVAAAPPGPQPVQRASNPVPQPVQRAQVSPSIASAEAALEEAGRATGMESPADAGASYARSGAGAPQVAAAPSQPVTVRQAPPPPPPPPAPRAEPRPTQVARSDGPWKVQLGAFGVPGNAERLWRQLSGRPEIAGRQRLLVPAGRVTKLQAGGYGTQAEAEAACRSLKRSGQECIVTR